MRSHTLALIFASMFRQQIQRFIINQHDNGLPLEAWAAINKRNMMWSAKFVTFDPFYYTPRKTRKSTGVQMNEIDHSVRTSIRFRMYANALRMPRI